MAKSVNLFIIIISSTIENEREREKKEHRSILNLIKGDERKFEDSAKKRLDYFLILSYI